MSKLQEQFKGVDSRILDLFTSRSGKDLDKLVYKALELVNKGKSNERALADVLYAHQQRKVEKNAEVSDQP